MFIVSAGAGVTAMILLLSIESFRMWREDRCAAYVVIALVSVLLVTLYNLSYALLEAFS
jgi:hypothetical protein